jgi:peptidoglycan/LPS O-acetylase OafA/YrhL
MNRSRALDVVRGLAILLVIGAHLNHLPEPSGLLAYVAHLWIISGWLGVDLFFVLSGFLIGGLLLNEINTYGTVRPRRFLIRRGLKIYPLYLLFIAYLIAVPTAKAFIAGNDSLGVLTERFSAYGPNLLFLHTYIGENPAGHTWSLAVEEHFYLTLPFVLLFLAKQRALNWVIPLCFLIVPLLAFAARLVSTINGADYADTMSDTQSRIDALMFGVGLKALSLTYPSLFARIGEYRWTLIAIGLLCWSPVLLIQYDRPFWFRTIGLGLTFLGSGAFLIAAVHTHASQLPSLGIQLARVISWIGIYSYAIYLWHITIIGIVDGQLGSKLASGLPTNLGWLVRVGLIVVSTCLIGALLSRLVEWPVLSMRDRWFPAQVATPPLPNSGRI